MIDIRKIHYLMFFELPSFNNLQKIGALRPEGKGYCSYEFFHLVFCPVILGLVFIPCGFPTAYAQDKGEDKEDEFILEDIIDTAFSHRDISSRSERSCRPREAPSPGW